MNTHLVVFVLGVGVGVALAIGLLAAASIRDRANARRSSK